MGRSYKYGAGTMAQPGSADFIRPTEPTVGAAGCRSAGRHPLQPRCFQRLQGQSRL